MFDNSKMVTNRPTFEITSEIHSILIIAASLMLGWTVLLIFGYLKPIERRFILLITAFPTIFGLFIAASIGYINGSSMAIIYVIKTFVLLVLFTLAFFKAEIMKSIIAIFGLVLSSYPFKFI